MPYSGIDDASLPKNVQDMPAATRKVWISTFNGVHKNCMDSGGAAGDCDGQAMKIANTAAKRMMAEATTGKATVELGHLGNLLKLHLDKNKISRGDLAAVMGYADVSSIGRLLAGEVMNVSEEKLKAAAKLLGISPDALLEAQHLDLVKAGRRSEELVSGLIFVDLANLTPGKPFDGLMVGKWTDMYGQEVTVTPELIKALIPNTKEEIASRVDEQGQVVGLPIDASKHDKGDGAGWIIDCNEEDQRVRVTANWTELGVEKIGKGILRFFSATIDMARKVILGGTLTNWPAVKGLRAIELVEYPGIWRLEAEVPTEINVTPDAPDAQTSGAVKNSQPINGDRIHMEMTKEELLELIGQGVRAELAGKVKTDLEQYKGNGATTGVVEKQQVDLLKLLEMEGATDQLVEAAKESLKQQTKLVKERAAMEYTEMLANLQRENKLAEFAGRTTAGSTEAPRGLPTKADDLKAALMRLPPGQEKYWVELLGNIQQNGLNEFLELGTSKISGTVPLPAELAGLLDSGELKIADLRKPENVELVKSLLDGRSLDQFDLKQWGGK